MSARDPAFEDWICRARAVSVRDELVRRGLWSKAMEKDNGVPCPACGGTDRFAVNSKKNVWSCRRSGEGGDAIALAQYLDGTDFLVAVETVLGEPPPERASRLSPAEREAIAAQAEARRVEAERKSRAAEEASQVYRERERRAARELWEGADPLAGSPAEAYLARRGLRAPPGARLRCHPAAPFWDRPRDRDWRMIHKGPALLGAIEGPDGRFAGVQRIWIDLDQPQGKALIVHPDTGEILSPKAARGSVKGGSILVGPLRRDGDFPGDRRGAARLFLGEGIETVLAVFCALVEAGSELLEGAEFRAAVSLGNMAGPAVGRVRHPTQTRTDSKGRVRPCFVPDGEPKDFDTSHEMRIASSVRELFLLGDGDSEPLFTRLALERAAKRFSRACVFPDGHLTVRLAMAAPGADFNDMWIAKEAAT